VLVSAISRIHYTALANNAAYNMLMCNNAQMSLLRNCDNINFRALAQADKTLTCNRLQNNLLLRYAEAMLENQKHNKARGFDTFA